MGRGRETPNARFTRIASVTTAKYASSDQASAVRSLLSVSLFCTTATCRSKRLITASVAQVTAPLGLSKHGGAATGAVAATLHCTIRPAPPLQTESAAG